ncbi:MAG: SLC13 family permease, partial [archaeon GB-1867-097]|nr:SLC13 family permease [Candidatus Culexmicrobium thermophilum]
DEIETGIDWNVIFIFGGGIAMGKALENSGFTNWLSLIVMNVGGGWANNPWTISAISAILGFLLTYPASNTASSIIACPLAAALAKGAGVNPIPPILSAALASSISSALPSTTPPMAIVYGSGYVKLWNMFKVGMLSDLIRLILLILLEPYLASFLLALKGLK